MKRVLSIIGVCLCVVLTVGVLVGVLLYTGVLDKKDILPATVYTYTSEDGRIYTEKAWDWKPIESKKVISYKDVSVVDKRTISLSLESGLYYDISIPDVPYIYDFGKTVWAEDGSFMIRVVGRANMTTLSALAGIDNGENINQFTLKSKDGVKGARTLATIIDDVAIVVNVYSGDETYSILRDSIANNRETYEIQDIVYAKGCKYLDEISYTGSYIRSVTYDEMSMSNKKYLFEDGALWIQSVVMSFNDTAKLYQEKLMTASPSGKVEQYYISDKIMFAKSGEYYAAVVYYNTNTSIAMVGQGEEALCNIVSIINDSL